MTHDSPPPAPGTNRVETFGCRLNAYESEVIRGHLEAAGKAGTIVVNTCAVTSEAERQARQAIRRLARENRSEEHTSELQSLMRLSYAVFCLKKTKKQHN